MSQPKREKQQNPFETQQHFSPKSNLVLNIKDPSTKSASGFFMKSTRVTEPDWTSEKEISPPKAEGFTSRLPAVTDLINIRPRKMDPEVSKTLLELTKYAQSLEQIIRSKDKEIQRLQYINKYLILAQQNREHLVIQTLEENRKLKEASFMGELRAQAKRMLGQAPNSNNVLLPKQILPIPQQLGKSAATLATLDGGTRTPLPNTQLNLGDKKNSSPLTLRSKSRQTNKLRPDRKKQSMLKMNEEELDILYAESENYQFLEDLLKNEENFIQEVTYFDKEKFVKLHDSIQTIRNDHMALRNMVFKLRRIIKATITMTTSLLLDEAIERIVDETCECLDCDRATTFIYDSMREELWSKSAKGSNETIRVPVNRGIVGHVFTKGEVLNIPNAYIDERFNKAVDMKTGYKTTTILTVPIRDDNGRVVGVLQAVNKKGSGAIFTKDDEMLLGILSNLAGVVLRNSMSYNEQLSLHNVLRTALKIGVTLNSFQDLELLLPFAEKKLRNLMRVEKVHIVLKTPNKDELFTVKPQGEIETYPAGCGIMGKVISTGEYQNITNGYNHSLFNGLVDIETSMPLLCVPIKDNNTDKPIGALQVINSKGVQGLSALERANVNPLDMETLEFFSKHLGQAIINCFKWGKLQADLKGEPYHFDLGRKDGKSGTELSYRPRNVDRVGKDNTEKIVETNQTHSESFDSNDDERDSN